MIVIFLSLSILIKDSRLEVTREALMLLPVVCMNLLCLLRKFVEGFYFPYGFVSVLVCLQIRVLKFLCLSVFEHDDELTVSHISLSFSLKNKSAPQGSQSLTADTSFTEHYDE